MRARVRLYKQASLNEKICKCANVNIHVGAAEY